MNGRDRMTACKFHDANAATLDRQVFEIVESAYDRREKVLIFVPTSDRAQSVDRLIWIFRQEAFIPHKIFPQNEPDPDTPVAIVTEEFNPIGAGILIAEAHCSLDFACGFETVHEFVNRSTPEIHQACRDRFRDYRTRGIPLHYEKDKSGSGTVG